VVVLDPQGRFAVPLLGGHGAGGEGLAHRIAALLGGQAVLSGASAVEGRLALDAFGTAWGWRRGSGDWRTLMVRAAGADPPQAAQQSGLSLWRELSAASGLAFTPPDIPGVSAGATDLVVSHQLGEGCRWHPPCLWIGLGCERDTSESLLERLVETTLRQHCLAVEAVAGLASATRKGDEPALLALAARRGWPLRLYEADRLAAVPVPTPSPVVARELGTPSVAEAAARLAAAEAGGTPASVAPLLVAKQIARAESGERGAATLAVALAPQQWAPARGALHLVGSGPGRLDALTGEAREALAAATVWVGYGLYLDLLEPLRRPDQLRRDGRLTEERQRCAEALALAEQGLTVALVSSGDSGIYGMAGLALELWLQRPRAERPAFAVHPGLSALQLAAARAGAPLMHDFCTISLSDRLTPWEVIERRLRAAVAGDFVVALYNPRSRDRDWQLELARDLLLEGRPASTPVVLARQLGRDGEQVSLHELGTLPIETVDMLTLVLVGNSSSRMQDDWMVTPRGYPGAELS
jgi:cobalt-precorrin 5A hydrolase/precorrin-3B C17-methyltransferase